MFSKKDNDILGELSLGNNLGDTLGNTIGLASRRLASRQVKMLGTRTL